jgi:hypothetical protein
MVAGIARPQLVHHRQHPDRSAVVRPAVHEVVRQA